MRRPSTVEQAIMQNRDEVLRGEGRTLRQLEQAYQSVVERTADRADELAQQIKQLRTAGEEVSVGKLVRLERYEMLIAQVQRDAEQYSIQVAAPEITRLQEENAWLAHQHAEQIERISLGDDRAIDLQQTSALSTAPQVETVSGTMGDGAPVREYLRRTLPEATVNAVETSVRDVVVGDLGPRQAAREMSKAVGIGLDRALTVARTESLRAYREAQRLRWQEGGAVKAYRRTAAKQTRTCMGCIAMDGAIMPMEQSLEDHPNGRCSLVPVFVVNGQVISPWRGRSARSWLRQQPQSDQIDVMGPGRFAAWDRGDVQLQDMARRVEDERFGGAWVPRTVRDIEETGAAGGRTARQVVDRTIESVA